MYPLPVPPAREYLPPPKRNKRSMLKYSSVRIAALTLAALTSHTASAAPHRALPKLTVSANHRYLIQ